MSVLDREEINAFTKEIVEATTDAAKEAILAQLAASGVVKSVQSGYVNYKSASGGAQYTDVAINTVNPSKCIVVHNVEGNNQYSSNEMKFLYPAACTLYANKLRFAERGNAANIGTNYYSHLYGSWQVVEFY